MLTEKDIRQYYEQASKLEPLMLINYLIKEIILFDDRVEIHYNNPLKESPDDSQDSLFYTGKGVIVNEIQHPKKTYRQYMTVEMYGNMETAIYSTVFSGHPAKCKHFVGKVTGASLWTCSEANNGEHCRRKQKSIYKPFCGFVCLGKSLTRPNSRQEPFAA